MTREEIYQRCEREIDRTKGVLLEAGTGSGKSSVAIHLLNHLNPDNALERTNRKFIKRFNYLEAKAAKQGSKLKDMTIAEMDKIWEEAKTFDN